MVTLYLLYYLFPFFLFFFYLTKRCARCSLLAYRQPRPCLNIFYCNYKIYNGIGHKLLTLKTSSSYNISGKRIICLNKGFKKDEYHNWISCTCINNILDIIENDISFFPPIYVYVYWGKIHFLKQRWVVSSSKICKGCSLNISSDYSSVTSLFCWTWENNDERP